jgi:hypothetical protein
MIYWGPGKCTESPLNGCPNWPPELAKRKLWRSCRSHLKWSVRGGFALRKVTAQKGVIHGSLGLKFLGQVSGWSSDDEMQDQPRGSILLRHAGGPCQPAGPSRFAHRVL